MLDSESPSGPDSPQGKFVAQDLAKVRELSFPALNHQAVTSESCFLVKQQGEGVQAVHRYTASFLLHA
jgi:hypothetical protein